jgi:uncharacterized protein (DUF2237 family)
MSTGGQDAASQEGVAERNVLGGRLAGCGRRPLTGFHRDGHCRPDPTDPGGHLLCAVMTREFLEHQRTLGNDLLTPRLELAFPGLQPGDRWCVVVGRWLQSLEAGCPPPVVLAATHEAVLGDVPLEVLRAHAADVPDDPRDLVGG